MLYTQIGKSQNFVSFVCFKTLQFRHLKTCQGFVVENAVTKQQSLKCIDNQVGHWSLYPVGRVLPGHVLAHGNLTSFVMVMLL